MAKCKICGARLADGVSRCPVCGSPVGATAESLQPKPQLQDQPRQSLSQQTQPSYGGASDYSSQPVQQSVTVQMPSPQDMTQPQTSRSQADEDATERELIDAYITGDPLINPTSTHALEHYRGAFCSSISWNWATAFFLGSFNLFYRRCWGWALLANVIPGLCGLLCMSVPGGPFVAYIVSFIIMGLSGDRIIYSRYRRTSRQARLLYPGDKALQRFYVARHGGTRTGFLTVMFMIVLVISCVIYCVLLQVIRTIY